MIKEHKEVRMVEQEVETSAQYFCDSCNKRIGKKILFPNKPRMADKMFYEVNVTNFWASELPISEYKHACSGNCLHDLLSEYIKDTEGKSGRVDFDIEMEYTNKEE